MIRDSWGTSWLASSNVKYRLLTDFTGIDAPYEARLYRLGEVLGSLKCDCREQLERAQAEIARRGIGVLLYLRQEGRGIGLINKRIISGRAAIGIQAQDLAQMRVQAQRIGAFEIAVAHADDQGAVAEQGHLMVGDPLEEVVDDTVDGTTGLIDDVRIFNTALAPEKIRALPDNEELKNKATVIVAKTRNGPTGEVDMVFIKNQMRFETATVH